jgi:hypothetical protein
MVVMDPPAPETVTMIDKKVTFAVATDATNVWHQRLGHLGTKATVVMSNKEIVLGIPKLEQDKIEVLFALDRNPFRSTGGTVVLNPTKGSIWTSNVQWK